jgi:hypothetical protein
MNDTELRTAFEYFGHGALDDQGPDKERISRRPGTVESLTYTKFFRTTVSYNKSTRLKYIRPYSGWAQGD